MIFQWLMGSLDVATSAWIERATCKEHTPVQHKGASMPRSNLVLHSSIVHGLVCICSEARVLSRIAQLHICHRRPRLPSHQPMLALAKVLLKDPQSHGISGRDVSNTTEPNHMEPSVRSWDIF